MSRIIPALNQIAGAILAGFVTALANPAGLMQDLDRARGLPGNRR